MKRSRMLRGMIAGLAVVALTACGGRVFQQPQVTLENVRLGGLGLSGGTLLVNLSIVNPNRFALNANNLQYELALSDAGESADTTWVPFAEGIYDQPFSVAAGDSATVQIPIDFTYSGIGSAANSLLRRGTFTYRARGTVDLRTPLGGYDVPFSKRGTVTLLGTP